MTDWMELNNGLTPPQPHSIREGEEMRPDYSGPSSFRTKKKKKMKLGMSCRPFNSSRISLYLVRANSCWQLPIFRRRSSFPGWDPLVLHLLHWCVVGRWFPHIKQVLCWVPSLYYIWSIWGGSACPLWVEVTEIHFFQHLLFSVCLLKCPSGEPTNLMRVTLTHQLQRNCLFVSFRFSVHIIQFHVHVIIPFIHNQSPSVAFHSTHRQLSLLLSLHLLVKGTAA